MGSPGEELQTAIHRFAETVCKLGGKVDSVMLDKTTYDQLAWLCINNHMRFSRFAPPEDTAYPKNIVLHTSCGVVRINKKEE